MALKLLIGFVALAVLLAAATLWTAARREAQAERSHPPEGRVVEVDGHKVHYVMRGSGPDLVLIHGASGSLRDWSFAAIDRLSRDYRVIAFDRPGLGYTPRLDADGASLREQAALLAAAADRLGAERPIVLGQSYGGAVALAWAVHQPERVSALVLLAAASHPWDTPLPRFYKLTSGPLAPVLVPLLTAWVPDRVVEDAIAEVFEPQAPPPGYAEHIGAGLTLRRDSLRENALHGPACSARSKSCTSSTRASPCPSRRCMAAPTPPSAYPSIPRRLPAASMPPG